VTEDELFDALDGLMAYDEGATDSGIHDEDLRERCKAELRRIRDTDGKTVVIRGETHVVGSSDAFDAMMHRFINRLFADGYGYSDVREFVEWMDETMEIA
jgi:hypothetical protein